ncbi:MAG: hypothetical protein RL338_1325 [Chloroflexota bacterium]
MLDDPMKPAGPGGAGAPPTDAPAGGASAIGEQGVGEAGVGEPVATAPVLADGRAPSLGHLLALLVGIAATVGILYVSGSLRFGTVAADERPGTGVLAPGASLEAGAAFGDPAAPVTVEIWADYQCPYCGLFTHGLEPTLIRDFGATGRAYIVFKDYAFLGQESIDAAVAARCAGRQGRYWVYHDLLYASQSGENEGAFALGNLVKLAEFAGLDAEAFGTCVADPAVAEEVAAETNEGRQLGVESTPTVRIVGAAGTKEFRGLVPLGTLIEGLEAVESGTVDGSAGSSSGEGSPDAGASPAP